MSKAEDQYKKVQAQIKKGKGVVASIREVAEQEGLQPGSVQTNYYKISRRIKATASPSNGNSRTRGPVRQNPPGFMADENDTILNNIMGEVRRLVQRNKELEAEHERIEQIERILTN